MKQLILILILSAISSADTLYVKKNRCILDNYYFQNSRFHYTYSSTGNVASTKTFKSSDLEYGYEYVNGQCSKKEPFSSLHMSYRDYKFMMALVGLLIGFSIFASILFIYTRRSWCHSLCLIWPMTLPSIFLWVSLPRFWSPFYSGFSLSNYFSERINDGIWFHNVSYCLFGCLSRFFI